MKKLLFSALLLMVAGVESAFSQAGMLIWENGRYVGFHISHVDSVQFVENATNYIGSDYVDLGLPSGTLWATCNVGAESPEQAGKYFAWGEVMPKSSYTWSNYIYCKGSMQTLTKYNLNSDYGYDGFTDGKTELDPEDDAATANWGADWQMPSEAQFEELINDEYTTKEFTTQNNVNGVTITSKSNGNNIFLPMTGYFYNSTLAHDDIYGYYWTRDVQETIGYSGYNLHTISWKDSKSIYMTTSYRYWGFSVRPVRVKHVNYEFVDLALPSGTLWSNCNIGATSPEDAGYYFAWGETTPKSEFYWNNYKYSRGSGTALTKYCTDSYYGNVDGLTTLWTSDDAATAMCGTDWQMPSIEQYRELINSDYTSVRRTMQNGVLGLRITSNRNGHSIFLPAAGYHAGARFYYAGEQGYYWSRDLFVGIDDLACGFSIDESGYGPGDSKSRYCGLTIRPVKRETHNYVDLGLPSGTLWAKTNVGARNPADYGNYYAWGEVTPKSDYSWGTYKWMNKGQATWEQINKYTTSDGNTTACWYADEETCIADYKFTLEPQDDAATFNWGEEWKTPTLRQLGELLNDEYTTKTWTSQSGSDGLLNSGYLITSKVNGNTLFLPAAGHYDGTALVLADIDCFYWSDNLYEHHSASVWGLGYVASREKFITSSTYRCLGYPVRPVRK